MKLSKTTLLAALGVLTPVAIAGGPGTVTTLFTNIATSATSDVPGMPGNKFAPGGITTAFERPWVSSDGSFWAIVCDTDAATTADSIVLMNGAIVAREGDVTPFAAPETYGPWSSAFRLGLNDSGELAFTNNTSAASTIDDYIAKLTAGPTWTTYVKQTQPCPALPTSNINNTMDGLSVLADGRIAYRADILIGGGISTANDEILAIDTTLIAQEGITVPAGQLATPMAWENFTVDNYWVSPDGAHVLIDGDVLGTTNDDVTTYDGTVVIQEGFPVIGTTFTSNVVTGGPDEVHMDRAGRWYARGNNVDGQDWVVRNGVVIAKTDDPIGATTNTFDGAANGAQVVPPSGSAATAVADFYVDTALNRLFYDVVLTGVTGETAANISGFAAAGANGAPLYSLPLGNTKRGFVTYPEIDEANLLAGLAYVEILTTGNPAGEIRGQIVPEVETWDDADNADGFFVMTGNIAGDYIVMGLTSGPQDANGVVVLNGTTVVLREGDPIDVDGNGLFDDDTFIQNFGNDDFALTSDGSIYFGCTTRNAATPTNTSTGAGFFRREGGNGNSFAFCFGDGTLTDHTTPCPCGNDGAPGNGCAHSFSASGANLSATGSVAPSGSPSTARRWFSNCEVTAPSIVQWPVLWTRGANSFASSSPSRSNSSTASTPT